MKLFYHHELKGNELRYPPTVELLFYQKCSTLTHSTNDFDKLKSHPLCELFYSQFYTITKTKKPRERETLLKERLELHSHVQARNDLKSSGIESARCCFMSF